MPPLMSSPSTYAIRSGSRFTDPQEKSPSIAQPPDLLMEPEKDSRTPGRGVHFPAPEAIKVEIPRPRIAERPLSSLSNSSVAMEDRRRSVAALRVSVRRHRKPRAADRMFAACRHLPLFVKAVLIIALTGAPIAVYTGLAYTRYRGAFVGDGRLLVSHGNLSVWLIIAWVSFLVVVTVAEMLGRFFSWLCHTSSITVKYAPLADTMWFRLTLMAWVGALHKATCVLWPISLQPGHSNNWVYTLRQVFEFMTVALAIFLVQGIVLQFIGIQYVQGYIGARSERAMDELETLQHLDALVRPRKMHGNWDFLTQIVRMVFLPRKSNIFVEIRNGRSTDEEVAGYAALIWATVAGSRLDISRADICERLTELGRDPEGGRDLFILLDRSGDNKVTRLEFEELVILAAAQLKKRAGAMRGITLLLRKLEVILCFLVFGLIMFVYSKQFLPSP